MTKGRFVLGAAVTVLAMAACGRPHVDSLRDSFAQQITANRFVRDLQRNGDDLTFTGPGAEGGTAKWRLHIDSTVVEANDDEAQPYKGTDPSGSWQTA